MGVLVKTKFNIGDKVCDMRTLINLSMGEYQKFRSQIDSLLQELEQYATTEEEIRRLITDKPDEGY